MKQVIQKHRESLLFMVKGVFLPEVVVEGYFWWIFALAVRIWATKFLIKPGSAFAVSPLGPEGFISSLGSKTLVLLQKNRILMFYICELCPKSLVLEVKLYKN